MLAKLNNNPLKIKICTLKFATWTILKMKWANQLWQFYLKLNCDHVEMEAQKCLTSGFFKKNQKFRFLCETSQILNVRLHLKIQLCSERPLLHYGTKSFFISQRLVWIHTEVQADWIFSTHSSLLSRTLPLPLRIQDGQ